MWSKAFLNYLKPWKPPNLYFVLAAKCFLKDGGSVSTQKEC